MNPFLRNLMAGLAGATTLLLTACGGGGGGGDSPPPPPVAVAKASAASTPIGTAVTLDGSTSTTPNGGTLSYQWTVSTKPEGSTATLSSGTDAKPTFTPDKPGDYAVDLVVKDAKAASAAARITLSATNPDPVAVIAQASQGVLQGSTVTLDGSTSLPPTGAPASGLSYQWRIVEQPTGDPATVLVNATGAKATFVANKLGIYRASLTVRHGDRVGAVVQAEVKVNNGNSAPAAKVTVPATVERGATVVLDGSGSTDADGDTLHFRWAFAPFIENSSNPPKPYASKAALTGADSARASFVADAVGRYYLDFTVYDGSVATTQRVTVNVTNATGAANSAPVAVFGRGDGGPLEFELGGWAFATASLSYDVDGDPLVYRWTWWNTATPNDKHIEAGASTGGLNLGNQLAAGTYQAELVVNDGKVDSATATGSFVVKIGANVAPTAAATVASGTTLVNSTVVFDGSASSDRNGDQLSYQWTLLDRPDGSSAALQNATSARATVVPDKPGTYAALLRVTDSKGLASAANTAASYVKVFAKAQNNAPVVANYRLLGYDAVAADQPFVMYPFDDGTPTGRAFSVAFTSTVFDPDLDNPLYYILTATRYPAGSPAITSISGQTTSGAELQVQDGSFNLTTPGEYEFQLLASDGLAYSETKRLNFSVVKQREEYPGVLLETGTSATQQLADFVPSQQLIWPFAPEWNRYSADALSGEPDTAPRVQMYRLYAGNRDYTVADLVVSSGDPALAPTLLGLRNGQVIRKGESAVFAVVRPAFPNEQAQVNGMSDMGGGPWDNDKYLKERDRVSKLYQSYRFTWSFRIAEIPGRVFHIGPPN